MFSHSFRRIRCLFAALSVVLFSSHLSAQHGGEADLSAKKLQPAEGLKVDVFASEPLLFNPVAFSIDEKGRFFISETHRYKDSIFDLWKMDERWRTNDFSWRTVEDREKFLKAEFATNITELSKDSEIIRLVEDKDGDGRAETSSVFADGFNKITSGTAAGILARKGDVWFTCIPDLWKFTENNGRSRREEALTPPQKETNETPHVVSDNSKRELLATGFGVHISVSGHDLHGLVLGPDGKIYFSVGDRGANIKTKEGKQLDLGQTGGVFRCNPDGSEMEIFAIGFRNPQELAFDEFGNLWLHDNDTAGEDPSRLIYVVEGGDYGWRQSYQFMEGFGPWVKEKVWQGNIDDVLPLAGESAQGPAGLAFYPGVGLPEKYKGCLLGCDFPQGVWAYFVKPNGAGYVLDRKEHFLWGFGATDVAFGPDCNVYVSDWGKSYNMPNAGKIYRVSDSLSPRGTSGERVGERGSDKSASSPQPSPPPTEEREKALPSSSSISTLAAEVKKLLGEGMEKRSVDELAKLLGHPDMRVRMEAQFELTTRWSAPTPFSKQNEWTPCPTIKALSTVALTDSNRLARIHAVWVLSKIFSIHRDETALFPLLPLLNDKDNEVAAQTAIAIGQPAIERVPLLKTKVFPALSLSLKNHSPRVRFHAAMSLGKLKKKEAIPALFTMLKENADKDAYLVHAGVWALVNIGDLDAIKAAATDENVSVRRGALLAMRRLKRPEIQQFLNDSEPRLVLEAARAINDVPIPEAMPQLAVALENCRCGWPEEMKAPMFNREINAAFRLGKGENLFQLFNAVPNHKVPEECRAEALNALADWENPYPLDRVVGLWRPVTGPRAKVSREALAPLLSDVLQTEKGKIASAALRCIGKLGVKDVSPLLLSLFQNTNNSAALRLEILQTLGELKTAELNKAVEAALADNGASLRAEAVKLAAQLNPAEAAPMLEKLLATETDVRIGQAVFDTLGSLKDKAADELLSRQLDALLAGKVKPELQLELIEAASKHNSPALTEKLKKYEMNFSQSDPLAPYRICLNGGDAGAGKKVFNENDAVGCLRCHAIKGKGGTVGPDLKGVASKHPREYFLESMLFPNKQIAPGFENVAIVMKNGQTYAGVVKSETDSELILNSPEDGLLTLKKAEIEKRDRTLSAMPEGLNQVLTKRDLRNLVEYLATLK